jgi:hypothetical protein
MRVVVFLMALFITQQAWAGLEYTDSDLESKLLKMPNFVKNFVTARMRYGLVMLKDVRSLYKKDESGVTRSFCFCFRSVDPQPETYMCFRVIVRGMKDRRQITEIARLCPTPDPKRYEGVYYDSVYSMPDVSRFSSSLSAEKN